MKNLILYLPLVCVSVAIAKYLATKSPLDLIDVATWAVFAVAVWSQK